MRNSLSRSLITQRVISGESLWFWNFQKAGYAARTASGALDVHRRMNSTLTAHDGVILETSSKMRESSTITFWSKRGLMIEMWGFPRISAVFRHFAAQHPSLSYKRVKSHIMKYLSSSLSSFSQQDSWNISWLFIRTVKCYVLSFILCIMVVNPWLPVKTCCCAGLTLPSR